MKRHLSVFALAARASFVKVIAVTLLTAILCGVLLWVAPGYHGYHTYDENGQLIETTYYGTPSGRKIVQGSFCTIPALLGFAAVAALLARIGTGKNVQPGYTALRLRIKPWQVIALWSLYNCIMVLFYRAVVTLVIYGVLGCRVRESGAQALLLASYGNTFLHNLLPLRDTGAWITLVASTLLTGVAGAMSSARQWRGNANIGMPIYSAIVLTAFSMNAPMGSGMVYLVSLACFTIIGAMIYQACKEVEDETDQ